MQDNLQLQVEKTPNDTTNMSATGVNSPVDYTHEVHSNIEYTSENEESSNYSFGTHNEASSHPKSRIVCPHCKISFSKEDKLLDHIQLRHNRRNNHSYCHLCTKVTDDDLALEMHLLEQHQVTTYKCAQCFYTIYELKNLVNHMTLRHSQSSKLTQHEALNLMKHSVCACLLDKMKKLVPKKWPPPRIRKSSLHKTTNSQIQQSSTSEEQHTSSTMSGVQHTNPLNPAQDEIPLSSDADQSVTRLCCKRIKTSKDCSSKFMKVDYHEEIASHQSENDDASSVGENFSEKISSNFKIS